MLRLSRIRVRKEIIRSAIQGASAEAEQNKCPQRDGKVSNNERGCRG